MRSTRQTGSAARPLLVALQRRQLDPEMRRADAFAVAEVELARRAAEIGEECRSISWAICRCAHRENRRASVAGVAGQPAISRRTAGWRIDQLQDPARRQADDRRRRSAARRARRVSSFGRRARQSFRPCARAHAFWRRKTVCCSLHRAGYAGNAVNSSVALTRRFLTSVVVVEAVDPREADRRHPPGGAARGPPRPRSVSVRVRPLSPPIAQLSPSANRNADRVGQPAVAIALQLHPLPARPSRAARPAGRPASCGSRRSPRPRRRPASIGRTTATLRAGPQIDQLLALAGLGQRRLAAGDEAAPVGRGDQQLRRPAAPPSAPTIPTSPSRSTSSRTGSPKPRPPGNLSPASV